ncbi:autotransporter outer membrane beta-barrel domain-containing protein [Serratia quinivorans]|uniref:autotransporter outer membrane beta-barrel domain-containing protein n=1 Tax=Serratia quinivorans TaxID=137545 RepID=UPI00107E9E81|nr:autotransporter outer membrane beta-barrel domain-containing protein [Serratia quinivorans]QBX64809.1 autotransporter outer membrane beta-barrel domain-containing protein [Serratia quinivorans]
MASFAPSFFSRGCLLALATTGGFSAVVNAASPWRVVDGSTLDVTHGYIGTTAGDYPLFSSGDGSLLQTSLTGLSFSTIGNSLYAANIRAGGSARLDGTLLTTNGIQAHAVNVDGGNLVMNSGNITVAGSYSAGVFGRNGARLSLNNLEISANGPRSGGVTLTDGTLTMSHSTIVATDANRKGISLTSSNAEFAHATLENVNIFLRGTGVQAALEVSNGRVEGNAVNISTNGENRGVEIYNSDGGRGSVLLNNSNISTQKGDGIYILNGQVMLDNTTVNTQGGMAVNLNVAAQASIRGGSFTTQSNYRDALWIATADSSADVTGATFTTYGVGSHAFNAHFGPATLTDSSLNTSGTGGYGLYSESRVQGNNLHITTLGRRSIGVFAARGGIINLDNARIETADSDSSGLLAYPGSVINGNALSVTTAGQDSHALWALTGTLNISNSTLTTQGNAAGLYIRNTSSGGVSNVVLDNVMLSSGLGPAIKTNGATLKLTIKNGSQLTAGNGVLLENLAGSGVDPNDSRVVDLIADNRVVLNGDIRSAVENPVDVALSRATLLNGAVNGVNRLSLSDSSRWTVTHDSTLRALNNDGQVVFRHADGAFQTLSLDSLSGNGAFVMNTDLAALTGDLITVSGEANGEHLLMIKNRGREPDITDSALTLVTTGGGKSHFALNNGAVDAGTYQYELQQRDNDWVLAQKYDAEEKPVVTPVTHTALGLFNATPTLWYGELTGLRTRMGEVRQGKQRGGAWVRTLGSRYQVNDRAGLGYRQTQSGISVGVDNARDTNNGQWLTGLFSGVSRNALDFSQGSTGTINSFFIGGYNTWLLESGWFVDALLKANNFSSHADVRMTDGEKTRGGYNTPGFGLSLEVGRQFVLDSGWFVEPSLQLATLWVKGQSYTFDNGLQATSGVAKSQQAILNGVLGRTLPLENGMTLQPWLRMAAIQEFVNSNPVSINGNGFNNDLSGTRGEYGMGLSLQLTPDVQMYTDARYSKGDKIESPWGANLGVRWSW